MARPSANTEIATRSTKTIVPELPFSCLCVWEIHFSRGLQREATGKSHYFAGATRKNGHAPPATPRNFRRGAARRCSSGGSAPTDLSAASAASAERAERAARGIGAWLARRSRGADDKKIWLCVSALSKKKKTKQKKGVQLIYN